MITLTDDGKIKVDNKILIDQNDYEVFDLNKRQSGKTTRLIERAKMFLNRGQKIVVVTINQLRINRYYELLDIKKNDKRFQYLTEYDLRDSVVTNDGLVWSNRTRGHNLDNSKWFWEDIETLPLEKIFWQPFGYYTASIEENKTYEFI